MGSIKRKVNESILLREYSVELLTPSVMANHNILLEAGTNELELIEFAVEFKNIDGEYEEQPMGINVIKVREIIRKPDLNKLPDLAEGVEGIINLRGQLIPAFNLGYLLYGPDSSDSGNRMIVAEFNGIRIGLIVHSVNRIHRISWSEVKPPEAINSIDPASATVVGIVNKDDKTILMIDVEKIVADVNTELALSAKNIKGGPFGENYNVVIAEDSTTIRNLVVAELSKAGFNIHAKMDGLSAWNHLESISKKVNAGEQLEDLVNLVITDIEMPQMDGYTLIKHLKADPVLSNLPVMIFSSMITEDNRHKGESVGANAQLTKPEIAKLLDKAKELLGIEKEDQVLVE